MIGGKHLRRIGAIIGGVYATWLFFFPGALLADSPLIQKVISCIPGAALLSLLNVYGDARPKNPSPAIPRVLLLLALPLILIVVLIGQPISGVPAGRDLTGIILYCLLIGVSEELICRGYFHALCSQWSLGAALIIPSLIFGLFHFQQGLNGICITFMVGLAFGLARIAGTPLLALIVVHALIDLPQNMNHSKAAFYAPAALAALSYTGIISFLFVLFPRHWLSESEVEDPVRNRHGRKRKSESPSL